jgi:phosphonate transport system substrate-binding protein
MRAFRFLGPLLGIALLAATVAGAAENKPDEIKELNFGIISTESTQGLKKGFEPFLEDMSKALGMKVNAFFATDYAGVIEAMRFGKVQIAWFGNKSAMEAVDRSNGEIFAQTVDKDGNPGYWSLILVHKDSPYASVDEIVKNAKDLTFGNGDPNSTSGYLIPNYYLWAQRGIDPMKTFKRVVNSNHEANLLSVANKKVDFATCNTEVYGKILKTQPELAAQVKPIWKSPLIPSDPLVWRKDLPKELKARIKGFVLSYGRIGPEAERQLAVLAGLSGGWAPFNDSNDRQLLPIREIEIIKETLKIESKPEQSPEDKAKLASLRDQLAELKSYVQNLTKFHED